ncbi:MAG: hypothetical protein HYX59_04975 [Elusimicrobia bacterium]|nr:hypothetical protein [Elusimicrobiota bacterium]
MRRLVLALTVLAAPASAGENADPGGSGMGSLIMGSWKQAEREGHKDFCFTGLAVGMNHYRVAQLAANEKEKAEMSGYYNIVTTYFMTPGLPKFSVTVHEPNGKGPNDPIFPLYNYSLHIDGDETVGHARCIAKLEVSYAQAVGLAAKEGLVLGEGNSQFLELRMASDPSEPGWSDKRLRGKTYWMVAETIGDRVKQYYLDAVTGKVLRKPAYRAKKPEVVIDVPKLNK